jgi:hypothetical protein
MRAHADYRKGLLQRFADRQILSSHEMQTRYWSQLPVEQVADLLQVVEAIYGIPGGVLRPEDPIDRLTKKVPSSRWWRWPIHETIAGDREGWLAEELDDRIRVRGGSKPIKQVKTVDELVRVWCGGVIA